MGPSSCSLENPAIRVPRTDNDLVQAAQSGDHEAFAELCRRHAQVARQKILAIVRHREDAEDALQETLLRAYANLGRFRQSSKFSTWITAIGINTALTVIRKRKSRRELDIEPRTSLIRRPILRGGSRKDKFCSSFGRSLTPSRYSCERW
jgi:DNA-directed RNA polymerase specialized sigma24 family protein